MARKRTQVKEAASVNKSVASIFQGTSELSDIDPEPEKVEKVEQIQPVKNAFDDGEDFSNSPYALRIIYGVQDYLNDNMTLLIFVQLCVFVYIMDIIYLKLDSFPKLKETWQVIGFNALGVSSGLVLNFVKNKDRGLPEFNQFYSMIFPTLYSVIHFDQNYFLANLCLNYFIADNLHPLFSMFCSAMFYGVYHEVENLELFGFVQMIFIHTILLYTFKYIGDKKSFSKTESQLLTIGIVNIFFNNQLINRYLPLQIFQKLLISLMVASFLTFPLYDYIPQLVSGLVFAGAFYYLTVYQLYFVLKENAVVWLYNYIFNDEENVQILSIWFGMLAIVIPIVFLNVDRLGVNFRRKIWHFLIIAILLFNRDILTTKIEFTLICLLGAIILFMITEMIRATQLTFAGRLLYQLLGKFQDAKDLHGPLNLSYIYLVLGVTLPIVYDYMTNDKATIVRYMGVLSLGIGDSMASIIGRKFGNVKWKGSNKSLQGTIAFILSTFAAFYLVDYYMNSNPGYTPISNWENVFVVTIITGLLEGASDLNDNFLIPIVMPITLEVLNRCF